MFLLSLLVMATGASVPISDCPPRGTPARQRLISAGAQCADDVREQEMQAKAAVAFVQRGIKFKDRPLPPAIQNEIKRFMDREALYDGLSARYEFPSWKHPELYCFRINAKNRMGAYTGWSEYAVELSPAGMVVRGDDGIGCEGLK